MVNSFIKSDYLVEIGNFDTRNTIYSPMHCLSLIHSRVLLQAIKRLSKDNVKLIEATCDILNRVFTKGKDMETMMEKLEDYKKEQKLNEGTCYV